jgi:hypothetical protein
MEYNYNQLNYACKMRSLFYKIKLNKIGLILDLN